MLCTFAALTDPDHVGSAPTEAPALLRLAMSATTLDEVEVTRLLQAAADGDPELLDRLARAVYGQLHRVAANALRHESDGHTLQTTVLVHEAFLRLTRQSDVSWQNRSQFYRLAAQTIRRLLIDHARRRRALKRQTPPPPDTLEHIEDPDERLGKLGDALTELARHDARAAQVVELRFFGGLSMEEVSTTLDVSLSTAKRDWRYAQAFLRRALDGTA